MDNELGNSLSKHFCFLFQTMWRMVESAIMFLLPVTEAYLAIDFFDNNVEKSLLSKLI